MRRITPYHRDHRPNRRWRIRIEEVDPLVAKSKSMLISLRILIQPFHQQLFAGGVIQCGKMPAPSTTASPLGLASVQPMPVEVGNRDYHSGGQEYRYKYKGTRTYAYVRAISVSWLSRNHPCHTSALSCSANRRGEGRMPTTKGVWSHS